MTIFAMCMTLLAAFLLVQRWRSSVKRLTQQRNELALAVMLRTREIEKEKKTIERQKEQIEALLEKARQTNRLKDEFLANISHEIRTPLHGILGMTELALTTDLSTEQREYLELASSSARSLLALVNDVLDFSKIESGHFQLTCARFEIRDCIQGAIGSFPLEARSKGVEFSAYIDGAVPSTMEGDAIRLRQILVNLIGNAVKFTEKGMVGVRVTTESSDNGPMLCVRVIDTGIGIARERQQEIFEPFRQVDGSATRKYGGTGLGLAISTRIARDMHGSLKVQSESGKGSTFVLRVPLSHPSSQGDRPQDAETFEDLPLTA
jgi:signal transduction histidine kinase